MEPSRLPLAAVVFTMMSREGGGKFEGFGLVFLEAAAAGKAVLGGRSGGVPDAVDEGRTGLLADPASVEETAAGLLRLLGDPALRSELGEAGRRRVRAGFRWSSVAERLLAELDQASRR